MIDRKTQMMDAGTVRFKTPKPFGTVLGGLKTEMQRYGSVLRSTDTGPDTLPPTCGPFDLFLDAGTPFRKRYIAATVEDAGDAGTTPDGEPVRWYAVTFKEGNRNTWLRIVPALLLAASILAAPFFCNGFPKILGIPAGIALAAALLLICLRPSRKAGRMLARLKDTVREGK